MKFRRRLGKRAVLGGILVLVAVLAAAIMLSPGQGDNGARAVPAQAMNRIAQKNDSAADNAATAMRERSALTARNADAAQDRQDAARNAAR